MNDQHAAAIAWARQQIGQQENPLGSNTGPFVVACQRATWVPGTRWPWCVAFAIRAWQHAGRVLPYRGAGAYAFLAAYERLGWTTTLAHAVPGDIVVWWIGSGHASLFEHFDARTGLVTTIDGNVNNRVQRMKRGHEHVRGVVHIRATPAPVKPPLYEVATSASGHRKIVLVGGRSRALRKVAALLNVRGGVTIRRRLR